MDAAISSFTDSQSIRRNPPFPLAFCHLFRFSGLLTKDCHASAGSEYSALASFHKSNNPFSLLNSPYINSIPDATIDSNNIFMWVKRKLEKGEELNIVDDQFRTPTLVSDLSQATYPKEPYISFLDHILVTNTLIPKYSTIFEISTIKMGDYKSNLNFYYRMGKKNFYHMPIATSNFCVYHEVFSGPFNKKSDVKYSKWSPKNQ